MLISQIREAQRRLRNSAAIAGVGSAIPISHGDELAVYLPINIWTMAYFTGVEMCIYEPSLRHGDHLDPCSCGAIDTHRTS